MSSPGFLDFFILEANEYIEQLDGLVLRAMTAGSAPSPDAEEIVRNARALRGSATMAKLMPFAELATSLERVGRGIRAGAVAWSPDLGGALTSTVDDLKLLVRAARNWTAADAERAAKRVAELARYAPAAAPSPTPRGGVPAATRAGDYFAGESANIAAGLELLATRPGDRDAAANVLRRLRGVRGVAGIRDIPALGDILEAAEDVARPLDLGAGPLSAERVAILRSAATLLRGISATIREGRPAHRGAEHDAFFRELETLRERDASTDPRRVVPIAELFYADGGPTLVTAAAHPPTTPSERFRLEIVSRGEHLRGVVAQARDNPQDADKFRRELRLALSQLRDDATSFGEPEVAKLVAAHLGELKTLDHVTLSSLDALAGALTYPGTGSDQLATRLAEREAGELVDAEFAAAMLDTGPSTPAVPPAQITDAQPSPAAAPVISHAATAAPRSSLPSSITPPMPSSPRFASQPGSFTPIGAMAVSTPRDTLAVLDRGIDSFSALAVTPLSAPVVVDDQPLVPIDALLYRGRAAIERAIELRETIRGGGASDPQAMDELFDLLDLALAE